MKASSRKVVTDRARNRCEYCRIHQAEDPLYTFHVEHVIASQHGGTDEDDNLALACRHCNLHKGPNLSGRDPLQGVTVELFNPRAQRWEDHFEFVGPQIAGTTATGRATVAALKMNAIDRVRLREALGYPDAMTSD